MSLRGERRGSHGPSPSPESSEPSEGGEAIALRADAKKGAVLLCWAHLRGGPRGPRVLTEFDRGALA